MSEIAKDPVFRAQYERAAETDDVQRLLAGIEEPQPLKTPATDELRAHGMKPTNGPGPNYSGPEVFGPMVKLR